MVLVSIISINKKENPLVSGVGFLLLKEQIKEMFQEFLKDSFSQETPKRLVFHNASFFKVQHHVAELALSFSASKPSLLRVDWAYDISNAIQSDSLYFIVISN